MFQGVTEARVGIDGKRFPLLGNRGLFNGAAPAHTKRPAKLGLDYETLKTINPAEGSAQGGV